MSNKEIIAEFDKEAGELYIDFDNEEFIEKARIKLFSKALDKARAEVGKELGTLRADLAHEKSIVSDLLENQKEYIEEISNLRTEIKEQVRKLKANINSTCDWKNSELNTLIDEIFAECAEKDKA